MFEAVSVSVRRRDARIEILRYDIDDVLRKKKGGGGEGIRGSDDKVGWGISMP